MQFSKNTSTGTNRSLLIKTAFLFIIIIGAIVMLNKIDFPSPNKEIEKIIPNENIKIIK